VVHGTDGLDEVSICAPTQVWELQNGTIREYLISPEEVGLQRSPAGDIKGGTAQENAATLRALFSGRQGALRDMVALNAAAALVAGDKTPDLRAGILLAQQVIGSGAALGKVDGLVRVSQSFVT